MGFLVSGAATSDRKPGLVWVLRKLELMHPNAPSLTIAFKKSKIFESQTCPLWVKDPDCTPCPLRSESQLGNLGESVLSPHAAPWHLVLGKHLPFFGSDILSCKMN